MNAHEFRSNFRRVKNAWVPRQAKAAGGKGPNATEARFLREVLKPRWEGDGILITYQPPPIAITRTAKREYTADYLVHGMMGREMRPTYYEVKGSYRLQSQDRARLAWEIAAEANPEATFVWAEWTGHGWLVETWENGGSSIFVHYPKEPLSQSHKVGADWRRHIKRGQR